MSISTVSRAAPAVSCLRSLLQVNPKNRVNHFSTSVTILKQYSVLCQRTVVIPFRIPVYASTVCLIVNRGLFRSLPQLASRPKKLPFEVDLKVSKDTLLYEHMNERFFRMLSIFGLVQLVFWGQLAVFSYTSLDAIESKDGDEEGGILKDSFWGKVVMLQAQYKRKIAGVCACVGTLVLFFTFLYPRRTIQKLVLLSGGQDLRVSTYNHFGKTRTFTEPVKSLSVLKARASGASQVSLKLKGHRFYYLMDKRDGRFHDTKLFDYAVGLKRKI